MEKIEVVLGGRRFYVQAGMNESGKVELKFPYNPKLVERVRKFEGRAWDGDKKVWTFPATNRNALQFRYLRGENIYERYDSFIDNIPPFYPRRDDDWMKAHNKYNAKGELLRFYQHQCEMASQIVHIHRCVFSCEMGTGKTLAGIEGAEATDCRDWWYVAPRSALYGVIGQFTFWDALIKPEFMTYEGMVKRLSNWSILNKPPQGVFFDESSRLKTPTAQRSKAAMHLVNAMQDEYKDECYVIEMSGTPAPKNPTDWWHQAEIACPGFIVEGSVKSLQERLALMTYNENPFGGRGYPELVCWWDNEERCGECGVLKSEHDRRIRHEWRPSINEVAKLYTRMKGLVLTKLKKDCLDLPEKQYKIIVVPPDPSLVSSAEILVETAPRAITAIQIQRQMSDGFLYEKTTRPEPCFCEPGVEREQCDICGGTGQRLFFDRGTKTLASNAKVRVLESLLDDYEEDGRVVIYAGFQKSIDIVEEVCLKKGWVTIKADGRGWTGADMLPYMDASQGSDGPAKLAFIGQPGAAGMGLTLTRSNVVIYFSNDYNAESRIQSEDRIHRVGMRDSATIIDIVHLPIDLIVLLNLKKKRTLQSLTMGDLKVDARDDKIFEGTEFVEFRNPE